MTTLAGIIDKFSERYLQGSSQLKDQVLNNLNAGMDANKAVTDAFVSCGLSKTMAEQVLNAQVEAVGLATGHSMTVTEALQRQLAKPWSSDNMSLSKRLHGATASMRSTIVDTIRTQQKLGQTVTATARALYDGYAAGHVIMQQTAAGYLTTLYKTTKRLQLGYSTQQDMLRSIRQTMQQTSRLGQGGAPNQALKAAYQDLLTKAMSFSGDAVEQALRVAIEEKSRYIAERIARTEAGRAYFDGVLAKYGNDADVAAYKWSLGSRHPDMDICDMLAQADLCGLGPGIYAKDKLPTMPAHPHCLCKLLPVYAIELKGKTVKDTTQAGGADWLNGLTAEQQASVLGIKGMQEFRNSGDWQAAMRSWTGLSAPTGRLTTAVINAAATTAADRQALYGEIQNGASQYMTQEQIDELNQAMANWSDDELKAYASLSKNFGKNMYHAGGGAYYSPSGHFVNMNINNTKWEQALGLTNSKGALHTKWHEEGHQLDHLLANTALAAQKGTSALYGMAFTHPTTTRGALMLDAIKADTVDIVNKAIAYSNSTLGTSIKAMVSIDKPIKREVKYALDKYLQLTIKDRNDAAAAHMVTDFMGLVSKDRIGRNNLSTAQRGLWGHAGQYNRDRDGSGATSETWASFMAYKLRPTAAEGAMLQTLAPNVLKVYNSIWDEVVSYAANNALHY